MSLLLSTIIVIGHLRVSEVNDTELLNKLRSFFVLLQGIWGVKWWRVTHKAAILVDYLSCLMVFIDFKEFCLYYFDVLNRFLYVEYL